MEWTDWPGDKKWIDLTQSEKNKVIMLHLSWVTSLSRNKVYYERMKEDAFHGGVMGVMKAAQTYNPAKGRFRTYARSFVIDGIFKEISKHSNFIMRFRNKPIYLENIIRAANYLKPKKQNYSKKIENTEAVVRLVLIDAGIEVDNPAVYNDPTFNRDFKMLVERINESGEEDMDDKIDDKINEEIDKKTDSNDDKHMQILYWCISKLSKMQERSVRLQIEYFSSKQTTFTKFLNEKGIESPNKIQRNFNRAKGPLKLCLEKEGLKMDFCSKFSKQDI